MAETLTIGGMYRFYDDRRDEWIEVPLAVELGKIIERLDAAMRKREQRRKKLGREVCCADVGPRYRKGEARGGLDPDTIADDRRRTGVPAAQSTANVWEGPRVAFRLLVGIGWVGWRPPVKGEPCPACGGRPLPPIACCVYCCRTGQDLTIGKPSPAELRSKGIVAYRPDGKAGGTGKAEPSAAKVKATAVKKAKKPKRKKARKAAKATMSAWRAELNAMKQPK